VIQAEGGEGVVEPVDEEHDDKMMMMVILPCSDGVLLGCF
jgi:hypothetical protein